MVSQERQTLARSLGLTSLTSIVVANMIGVGIFTTSGLLLEDLGNPIWMLLLWAAGGIIALCGAISYGELGAAMPQAGGEYVFLSRIYSPFVGFLSGWVSFVVGFSAPIAAAAIGFSEYLFYAFPETGDSFWLQSSIAKKITAVVVILLFSFIHQKGIKLGAMVQNALTALKVLLVAGLVLAGFLLGEGDMTHFGDIASFSEEFPGWKTMGLALMWVMFAYSGWNAATYIGSEVRDPQKNLPRSLLLGTAVVMLLYLLLNTLFIYAIPLDELKGEIAVGGLAVGKLFGGQTDSLFSIMIAFALFSSLSAFIIMGPRVYYAMARDGYFFHFLAKVHPVFKVPSRAIWIQALISTIIVIAGAFDQILTYMGFALGLFPLLAVAGIFLLRNSGKSVIHMPGYPWVQLFFLLSSFTILILAYMERPVESSVALLTVAAGIPFYYLFKRRHNKQL